MTFTTKACFKLALIKIGKYNSLNSIGPRNQIIKQLAPDIILPHYVERSLHSLGILSIHYCAMTSKLSNEAEQYFHTATLPILFFVCSVAIGASQGQGFAWLGLDYLLYSSICTGITSRVCQNAYIPLLKNAPFH